MASVTHNTFRQVFAHTAKCEKCGRHNKNVLYRCLGCFYSMCTPCWDKEEGTGRHKSIAITEPLVILPPLPPNKSKKKDKPATRTQLHPKHGIPHARTRKNVAVSDSETDDEKMPDAAAEVESSKKQRVRTNTDHTAGSSNDEKSGEYPDDLIEAADLLLGFFHAADTPMSAISATSTDSGLAEVLNATATLDRRPKKAPRQQRPSTSLTSDPSARLYELNRHYSREDPPPYELNKHYSRENLPPYELNKHSSRENPPPSAPEEGDGDVDMNDYHLGSSFTPINAPKETIRPKEPRKSPTDRFIPSRRPERPREALKDDRAARGIKKTEIRYEESDSDVEIVGARRLSDVEIVGARRLRHVEPSFEDGNGNVDGRELIPRQTVSSQDRAFSNNGAARSSNQYPTAPAERRSGGR